MPFDLGPGSHLYTESTIAIALGLKCGFSPSYKSKSRLIHFMDFLLVPKGYRRSRTWNFTVKDRVKYSFPIPMENFA